MGRYDDRRCRGRGLSGGRVAPGVFDFLGDDCFKSSIQMYNDSTGMDVLSREAPAKSINRRM
jgi:hypothetical protein